MQYKDLFFELGCEELPPTSLLKLRDSLKNGICTGLEKANLEFGDCKSYATPRRLAVWIQSVQTKQADSLVEKRGPAIKAAYDNEGNPSKAALGFAKSCGVEFSDLGTLKTEKGEWLAYENLESGIEATALIPDIIQQALTSLPIAKRMRWANFDYSFVRPVHWAILLFDTDVIDASFYGAKTSNQSFGHRFHAPEAITINHGSDYCELLQQNSYVLADFKKRRDLIAEQANDAAEKLGGNAHIEPALLDEITALVEFPVAVTGGFDDHFLSLPKEVLITTMQGNQKYFPVLNKDGGLLPHFITISNIQSTSPDSVRDGNERVISPRLSDAEFFWDQDIKTPLAKRVESLGTVVFQHKLGSLLEKTQRVEKLAEKIAGSLGNDTNNAMRAALLCKTDLVTDMVGEFASLQGIMGRYYASQNSESNDVATAIEEQYLPKQSGGKLPSTAIGQTLALADKIDTLVGIFSVGLIPTGDKDPFALRRAALGILRIIIEQKLTLDLKELVEQACSNFSHSFDSSDVQEKVLSFLFDRLKGYAQSEGYSADHFNAVIAVMPTQPLDFMKRLSAVKDFTSLEEAESLCGANKRIHNLLKKAPDNIADCFNSDLLKEAPEVALNTQLQQTNAIVEPLISSQQYIEALKAMSALKSPIDAFFEDIFIMADDQDLRFARLALLEKIHTSFKKIADISTI
jgi:glycyl-tRNA synthetase beta chain